MAHGLMVNDEMAYVGSRPWHNLGVQVQEGIDSQGIMEAAKLDWAVSMQEVFAKIEGSKVSSFVPVNGFQTIVREDTQEPLGVVRSRYRPIQNSEMFSFADSLNEQSNNEAKYETAGSLFNGRKVWTLLKFPERTVLEDKYEPYLFVSNSFDGSSAFMAGMTQIRVVCNNTLTAAVNGAKRVWSIRHIADVTKRVHDAMVSLQMADKYLVSFEQWAEQMATKKVDINKFIPMLLEYPKNATVRITKRVDMDRADLLRIAKKDDLSNYKGTAFGAYQATADYVSNRVPRRKTKMFEQRRMDSFMTGETLLAKTQELLESL